MLVCIKRDREVTEFIKTRDFNLDEIKARVTKLDRDYNVFTIKEDELKNYVPFTILSATKDDKNEMELTKTFIQIKDIDLLNALCDYANGSIECFISLNGGIRSSKSITLNEDYTYTVLNEIDDTEDELTKEELFNEELTNIGKAMKVGAFYAY